MNGKIEKIWSKNGHGKIYAEDGNHYFVSGRLVDALELKVHSEVVFSPRPAPGKRWPRAQVDREATRLANLKHMPLSDWSIDPEACLAKLRPGTEWTFIHEPGLGQTPVFRERAICELLTRGKDAWPIQALGAVAQVRLHDYNVWLDHIQRSILDAWLQSDSDAILIDLEDVLSNAPSSGPRPNEALHLARKPFARSAVRYLAGILGCVPQFRFQRGKWSFARGRIRAEQLPDNALPPDFDWTSFATRGFVPWITDPTILSKDKTTHRVNILEDEATAGSLQFCLVLTDQKVQPSLAAAADTRLQLARAGVRAATVFVDSDRSPEAELGHATRESLTRNLDVIVNVPVSGAGFFGREKEIVSIHGALASRGCVALVGARKAGKSSLAREVCDRWTSRRVAHITLDHNGFLEPDLANDIGKQVSDDQDLDLASYRDLASLLREVGQNPPTVLVVDELGLLYDAARRDSRKLDEGLGLLNFLRRTIEENLVHVIACSPRRSVFVDSHLGKFQEADNPILGLFAIQAVSGLDHEAGRALLNYYARRGLVRVDHDAMEYFVSTCGGFPSVLRAAFHQFTDGIERPMTISLDDLSSLGEPTDADDSAWFMVRDSIWKWCKQWAEQSIREILNGNPITDQRVLRELQACGLVDEAGANFAFPLLEAVALEYSADVMEVL